MIVDGRLIFYICLPFVGCLAKVVVISSIISGVDLYLLYNLRELFSQACKKCLYCLFTYYAIINHANRYFSLHMHAKPSFAHRLQTAQMASSRTSAQNNGLRAQKNGTWV